ncbi:MAG: pyridoxal phosphate-dependent aminotransferase [Treponema sp.]|nr:pyridoxal phosphate-dependent aminotransferase [Treponema sp.]
MAISPLIKNALGSSSMIRKMFEEGTRLKKQYGEEAVFDFSIGNPDIEPPPAFHRVLLKLASQDAKGSHGYMPNAGFTDVRNAMAEKVSREHKVHISGDHIVMSVGAAGGLNTVFKTICSPGDEVIVPRPYFMEYRSYVSNHNAVIVEVDTTDNFNLDLAAIGKALTPKTKAVLINSPHNPTGRVYDAATITGLAAILRKHGEKTGMFPYLVADEPYREISYGHKVPPILSVYSESIVVNSFSKSLSLPGERIGYIAVAPDISDFDDVMNGLIYSTRVLGYVNAPALMQRIVAHLIFARVDAGIYKRRLDAFKKVLDNAGIEYIEPQGAFYLFCKAPRGDDMAFVNHLKDFLILGVPGTSFGKPGWMRLAYCVDEKIIHASQTAFKKAMEAWK